eukprot:TRINITY_DN62089_c0_g1_i2.p1 TRINITY_DN62089_c0_g1~~TRINITY_DN62089_c0_g1_i2.p1  ORF type:complete len:181 (-),score=84.08 TRINITY_DN62089_c0_g1_i2:144-686(-)
MMKSLLLALVLSLAVSAAVATTDVVYTDTPSATHDLTAEDVKNWHEPQYAPSSNSVMMRFRQSITQGEPGEGEAKEADAKDEADVKVVHHESVKKGPVDEEADDMEGNTKPLTKQEQEHPKNHNQYYYPMQPKAKQHLFGHRWVTVKTQYTHNWKDSHMTHAGKKTNPPNTHSNLSIGAR